MEICSVYMNIIFRIEKIYLASFYLSQEYFHPIYINVKIIGEMT